MGTLTLNGATSGQITLAPTAVAGTNTLTLPAATGTVLTSSGSQTITGTMVMGSSFLRNRFINGNMQIWQRGTSFSTPASGSYTADRMYVGWTGAAPASVAQVAGPTGFTYAARITGAASNTLVTFGQKIESANCADLANKSVTVSVVLLASVAQTFTWAIFYANATDNFSASTQIATGSWSVTTSAATYTATISLPSQAANGLQFQIYPNSAGAFTSGTFDVTGLQLEEGSSATPFERPLISKQVADCQRYYCKTFSLGTAPGNNITSTGALKGASRNGSTTEPSANWKFPVSMRTEPTVTLYNTGSGTAGQWSQDGGATSSANARSQWISTEGCAMDNTGTAFNNVSNIQAAASAEL
jgi:hypothetical protein